MAWFRSAVASICVAARATTVYAQPQSEGGTLPPSPPTREAEPLQQPTTSEGETMRQRGDAAMREGRYGDAAAAYADAHAATQEPEMLLAIGDANQKLRNCEVAVDYYRRYQRSVELTPDVVSIIDKRIAACSAHAAADNAQASAVAPPPSLRASKRWMIGLEMGVGDGAHAGSDICLCDFERSAHSGHLELGRMRAPHVAWVASLGGDVQDVTMSPSHSRNEVLHFTLTVGARWWMTPRWWIEGTSGLAVASASGEGMPATATCSDGTGEDSGHHPCPPDVYKPGLALSGSAGVELLSFRSLALSAQGRIASGIYSEVWLVIATAGLSAQMFF